MTRRTDGSILWQLAALALATLLPSLGTSIANVVLPTLATSFEVPLHEVQWVVIAYLLTITTLIVGAGRLGDLRGRRRVLLLGIGIFTAASVSVALAPTLWWLVGARAMQGVGAAIMLALSLAGVRDIVPKDRLGSVMGMLGTVSAIGTALGPSLGGALISSFGWPAVFGFMAAGSAFAFVLVHLMLPADAPAQPNTSSLDVTGTLLLVLSLGAYALAMTSSTGLTMAILLALSALGLLAFVMAQSRAGSPIVDIKLLRERTLSAGLISLALVSSIVMATLIVGPFYLSGVLGLSPLHLGLVMSIGPGVAALVGLVAGRLVDRLGSSSATVAGLVGVAAGSALMTIAPPLWGLAGYIAPLALITAAYALLQAANNTAVLGDAAEDRRGVTAALLGLARNLGLITGASAMGAVFAYGSRGIEVLGLASGSAAGMQLTFAVAAVLAAGAIVVTRWPSTSRALAGRL